jgi:hypothetical protein
MMMAVLEKQQFNKAQVSGIGVQLSLTIFLAVAVASTIYNIYHRKVPAGTGKSTALSGEGEEYEKY